MAEGENHQPIIIKKKKGGGHGHHGGAWKVAYADFVTAMMAFFLVLWLLNAVTEEQLNGIADYFAPPNISQSKSGAGGVLGGRALTDEGAKLAKAGKEAMTTPAPPPKPGEQVSAEEDKKGGVTKTERDEMAKEQAEFEKAKKALNQALQDSPELRQLSENLIVESTAEGLRIQLVDQQRTAMFPSGSSQLLDHTRKLMETVADVVREMPNDVAIAGHTDATPFRGRSGYTNWELSAARAAAVVRMLTMEGIEAERLAAVGYGQHQPVARNDTEEGRRRNRRGVLLVSRDASIRGALR